MEISFISWEIHRDVLPFGGQSRSDILSKIDPSIKPARTRTSGRWKNVNSLTRENVYRDRRGKVAQRSQPLLRCQRPVQGKTRASFFPNADRSHRLFFDIFAEYLNERDRKRERERKRVVNGVCRYFPSTATE